MEQILLAYGSGGTLMHDLIEEMFIAAYGSDVLRRGDDAAVLDLDKSLKPRRLAFTTDSFVVTPHFFPGGDIGRLAVCGTVNDLATSGATPKWLSVGFILEEGFAVSDLRTICTSIAQTAQEAGVEIVTGDTKVVPKGFADGIFINTSGVGIIGSNINLGGANLRPGDKILVSGTLGDHGIAIACAREQLQLSTTIESDAAPLNHMMTAILQAAPNTHCFRDPTRGGLASTLNELSSQSQVAIYIDEESIPINDQVRGVCDMLGYDYLQVANEGKIVCAVAATEADAALSAMKSFSYGVNAAIVGEVCNAGANGHEAGKVFIRTAYGTTRILDMLVGELLPRIC